jgi:hypothetical protein
MMAAHKEESFMIKHLAVALALLLSAAAAWAGTAKGTMTVNGKKVEVKYAYATRVKSSFDKGKMDVLVLVSDKELPDAAIYDEFERMSVMDKLKPSGLSFQAGDDKRITSSQIYSPFFKKMSSFSSVGEQSLETSAWGGEHVAGRVWLPKPAEFFDEHYQYDITFDAVIGKPAPPKPLAGTPLPPGGGDPGKAYAAYTKALMAGDVAGMKAHGSKELIKQLDSTPELPKMLGIIREMQPKAIKITGGAVDGDTATLLAVAAAEKGSHTAGTITLVREGGKWKLQQESWKTTSD